MTGRSAATVTTQRRGWTSPLAHASYDRAASLSAHELSILKEITRRREAPGWSPAYERQLARLLRPLRDAMAHLHSGRRSSQGITSHICREMYKRRISYWGWRDEEWREVIGGCPRLEHCRGDLLGLAYLLCDFRQLNSLGTFHQPKLAAKVFGQEAVARATKSVSDEFVRVGYGRGRLSQVSRAVAELLLVSRRPQLEDVTREALERVYRSSPVRSIREVMCAVSHALYGLGIIREPLSAMSYFTPALKYNVPASGVPAEWADWCRRWRETTAYQPETVKHFFPLLLAVGRWLQESHPEITSPASWSRDLAAECVAMIRRMTYGQYSVMAARTFPKKVGGPLKTSTKAGYLSALRVFFKDLQEWELIERRFDPRRAFAVPRDLLAQLKPNPRVISDDVWFKLLHAGLSLAPDDLPRATRRGINLYPLELVKAVAVTWLFAGLRSDELIRLRVGCVRWQREEVPVAGTEEVLPKEAVCLLDVPAHKTGHAFTKPVEPLVGKVIEDWQKVRPEQPDVVDQKTGERVYLLFSLRSKRLGRAYINRSLIPILCRKAGVPEEDARGRITSHRARHTIATQLYNAREPMTLTELQAWLGHSSPHSTQYYAQITPTRLAKSYTDAGYFGHALRAIDVLVNQQVIKNGAAARGEPWLYYDLGHGLCTYDYYSRCRHRMACAKCDFYVPKSSSRVQMLGSRRATCWG